MNSPTLSLTAAAQGFAECLAQVGSDDWSRPTPCSAWDVRALVNHVIGANVRYHLLLQGADLAEVEATREVDHLGADPLGAFDETTAVLVEDFGDAAVAECTFRHVTGERTGGRLLVMRTADVGVHTWDLARAIGVPAVIDAEVVTLALAEWPAGEDEDQTASAQDRLLRRTGRDPAWEAPR